MLLRRLEPDYPLQSPHSVVIDPSLTSKLEARSMDAPTYTRCNILFLVLELSAQFFTSLDAI